MACHEPVINKIDEKSSLPELAAAIRRLNREISTYVRATLRGSLDLGDVLSWARVRVEVRGWKAWRHAHCPDISARWDVLCRQLAASRAIIERELAVNPDLSIRDALKLITTPKVRTKPERKPEACSVWKNWSEEERRAALDAGGIDRLLEDISPELRAKITKRLKPTKAGDEVLGERIRDLVDKVRALLVHPEQHKDEINRGLTAIKRATRGVGKAPITTPLQINPVVSKAIEAMGPSVGGLVHAGSSGVH